MTNDHAHIHPLSDDVIHAIAAGEVVERPAIIAKELIENALDAGATQISLHVEEAGLRKIVVADNGFGMSADDLKLSVQRHTTSKISHPQDLIGVRTFGFRGEALASIASVSRVTIQSKTAEAAQGYKIIIDNGELVEESPVGMPNGTVVSVEDVFAHVPARRKFLKKPATEFRHLTDVVIAAAISHPEVSFSLIHNAKRIIDAPATHDLLPRLTQLFGHEATEMLLPFSYGHTYFQTSGFIGTPQAARHTQPIQYIFVNRRHVTHPPLLTLIKQTYGSLLEPRQQPLFILHLDVPPATIDINIHPRKETIRFMDERPIHALVQTAIEQTLSHSETDLTYHYHPTQPSFSSLKEPDLFYQAIGASAVTAEHLKSTTQPWKFDALYSNQEILQVDQTYLIVAAPSQDGFLVFDQHAAHERILFEQFLAAFQSAPSAPSTSKQNAPQTIPLTPPVTLQFSPIDTQILQEHLEILNQVGVEISHFGGNTFRITHIPSLLRDRSLSQLIHEILDDIRQNVKTESVTENLEAGIDRVTYKTIAYLACRAAVKAGDPLTQEQRLQLIEKLQTTPHRFTCPHGRPTTISFSIHDLEKLFKRKK